MKKTEDLRRIKLSRKDGRMRNFTEQVRRIKQGENNEACRKKTGNRRRIPACRGSFTVEAVFLFPIIILLIAFMLHLSMDWFESVRQTAADVDVLLQMDSRTYFLNQNTMQEILELFQ